MLVAHWQHLGELAAAHGNGTGSSGGGETDGDGAVFGEELHRRWWRPQDGEGSKEEDRPSAQQGSPGGAGEAVSDNVRDRVFHTVLPSDWHLEAPEPPGLACTLFRYQRRCLAWLQWRESLSGGGGVGQADAGGSGGVKLEPEFAAAAPGGSLSAVPDARSLKAQLPCASLLWQPLVLPSGLRVWENPLQGGVRHEPAVPPPPEVPGGLLSDEMGLGEPRAGGRQSGRHCLQLVSAHEGRRLLVVHCY